MLGGLRVGPAGQPDVVGHVGARGEDLGPVHHVLVAVAHGPGAQRGQVGAGLGLGVADGEVDVAGQDAGQEVRLLLLGAEAHERRPDRVDGDEGERGVGPAGLDEEDELVGGRPALAAVLLGPAHAEPAVGADLADDLSPVLSRPSPPSDQAGTDLVGEQVGVVGPQLLAQSPAARGSPPGTWSESCPLVDSLAGEDCNRFHFGPTRRRRGGRRGTTTLRNSRRRRPAGAGAGRGGGPMTQLKLGLQLGYWGAGPPRRRREGRRGRAPRLRLGLDGRGVRLRRPHAARLVGARTSTGAPRDGDRASSRPARRRPRRWRR